MARTSKYTLERLSPIVARHISMGAVLDELGLRRTGGNYRHIGQRISAYEIDTSHFLGQAHNRGKTKESDAGVARSANFNRTPDEIVFRTGSTFPSGKLRKRLVDLGWEESCQTCGLTDWIGQPITLHVDHINGKTSDNRLDNLRFLCTNCHQQTRTWGAKKRHPAP